MKENKSDDRSERSKNIGRNLLGLMLVSTGISHLTWARVEFKAQVPDWVPVSKDLTVVLSGIAELAIGCSLILLPKKKVAVGWITATFFVLIFPGNIAQFMDERDAFGLNSDLARGIRLLFQPVLVAWALWSTGAWLAYRIKKQRLE